MEEKGKLLVSRCPSVKLLYLLLCKLVEVATQAGTIYQLTEDPVCRILRIPITEGLILY